MPKSRAGKAPSSHSFLQHAAAVLLAPVPLGLLQPLFSHIARHVAQSRPELFDRLGQHAGKRFLIDPTDLPFTLLLIPTAAAPRMTLYRRHDNPTHDAAISGSFFNLLELIDGSLDGDALFFSRVLRVTGDTEAIVALRNALDDFDGNVLDNIVRSFGLLAGPASVVLAAVRSSRRINA